MMRPATFSQQMTEGILLKKKKNIKITAINPLAMAPVNIVRKRTITFEICYVLKLRSRTLMRMIFSINNYLKFLHPIHLEMVPDMGGIL